MKKMLTGVALVAIGATSWMGAAPAHAMGGDAVCNSNEMCIYYNSNYGGVYDNVGSVSRRDLAATKNENASFKWI